MWLITNYLQLKPTQTPALNIQFNIDYQVCISIY